MHAAAAPHDAAPDGGSDWRGAPVDCIFRATTFVQSQMTNDTRFGLATIALKVLFLATVLGSIVWRP